MDRILFNDDMFEESYTLNPCSIFGDDVGEWTMEEFYQEAFFGDDGVLAKSMIGRWVASRKEIKAEKAVENFIQMCQQAPITAQMWKELHEWEAVPKFITKLRVRWLIVNGVFFAAKVISLIAHETMFKSTWGRFPADLKSFYEFVFSVPEQLTPEDIKKLKTELKKLRKDTKWLVGKAGNEFITPKERQLVELMNNQLDDLLTWRMMPKDLDVQKTRRIHDRLSQFIETSHDFLKLIHDDMDDTKTKNTMKESIK